MKVLIGIATRNRASILPRAIRSALDQDYADKEVVVFDDASTDDTAKLKKVFPEVRWLTTEEQCGCIEARNRLMSWTDAAFYCSLDDDAWFVRGDEISEGVRVLRGEPRVAAIAFDIVSPDRPADGARVRPYRTHMFVGCGHMVRLSVVREVGYYVTSPGLYGSEEKDLCVRFLNRRYDVMFLPAVYVWHERSSIARDLGAQHRSGVCNDLSFVFRRCPWPMIVWLVPGKICSHVWFAVRHKLMMPCLSGLLMFLKATPQLRKTREAVSSGTFREFLSLSRSAQ